MIPARLHARLIEACQHANIDEVKYWLDEGADPNFNIKIPINALDIAIQTDNHKIINLLLEHGAIVKEFVLQRAIEKNKNYSDVLIPDFSACKHQGLLMGVLQAAININDYALVKQAIDQGAKAASLYINTVFNLDSIQILQLLIENDFGIHADNNAILTEWMGTSEKNRGGESKPIKYDLLAFICEYYLEKPNSIEQFKSWRSPDKSRLFRMGLSINNFKMMKFAVMIGVNKNESLNSALYQRYALKQGNIHSNMLKNHKGEDLSHEIIEYLLNSNITFNKVTISNAVCFQYTELLDALSLSRDLEYGYEMAYKYKNDNSCKYFIERGVSKEAQYIARMNISAIKGDIKELRKAINDGANLQTLDLNVIVEVINQNQVESLKCLHDSGLLINSDLNQYLDTAMNQHQAYETITYLIELGLDITCVKNVPRPYKKKYPTISDMREKRFTDIFDYTIYLVKEIYPQAEGKEKEELLKTIAELSTLPYVIKRSEEKSHEH